MEVLNTSGSTGDLDSLFEANTFDLDTSQPTTPEVEPTQATEPEGGDLEQLFEQQTSGGLEDTDSRIDSVFNEQTLGEDEEESEPVRVAREFGPRDDIGPDSIIAAGIWNAKESGKAFVRSASDVLTNTISGAATLGAGVAELQIRAMEGLGMDPDDFIAESTKRFIENPEMHPLFQLGQDLQKGVEELFPGDPEFQDTWMNKFASGAGSLAGFIGGGVAGRGLKLGNFTVNAVVGSLSQAQAEYEQAAASGADQDTAFNTFLANLPVGALEALPIGKAFRRIDKLGGGSVKKALAAGTLSGTVEEGLQEATSTAFSNVAASQTYDETRNLLNGVLEAGVVGGLLGGAVNGASAGLTQKLRQVPTLDDVAEIVETETVLDEKQLEAFTTTPEFEQAFGESEVVAEDGSPQLQYHWTRSLFTEVDTDIVGLGMHVGTRQAAQDRKLHKIQGMARNAAKNNIEGLDIPAEQRQKIAKLLNTIQSKGSSKGMVGSKLQEVLRNIPETQELEAELTKAGVEEFVNRSYLKVEKAVPLPDEVIWDSPTSWVQQARRMSEDFKNGDQYLYPGWEKLGYEPQEIADRLDQVVAGIEEEVNLGLESVGLSNLAADPTKTISAKAAALARELAGEGNNALPQINDILRKGMQRAGFDGVSYVNAIEDKGSVSHIVFDTEQIIPAPDSPSFLPRLDERDIGSKEPEDVSPFSRTLLVNEMDGLGKWWNKSLQWLDNKFKMPDQVQEENLRRNNLIKKELFTVKTNLNRLADALRKEFDLGGGEKRSARAFFTSGKAQEIPDATYDLIQDVLTGGGDKKVDYTALPPGLRGPVRKMRLHVDRLSRSLIREGVVDGDLAVGIKKNLGVYLTRSYRVFEPNSEWHKNVPEEVRGKAVDYIVKQSAEEGTPLNDTQAKQVVEDILQDSKSPFRLLAEGKVGQVDTSVLRKKKQIAPEIRALMGEFTDPFVNYARSATKVTQLVENRKFLSKVRERGKGVWFFDPMDPEKPEEFNRRVAQEGDVSMEPLAGLVTHPDIAEAFEAQYSSPKESEFWASWWSQANSVAKYSKTVLNQVTHFRNVAGGGMFFVANGHSVKDADFQQAYKAAKSLLVAPDAEVQGNLERMAELGLLSEGARSGEIKDIIKATDPTRDTFFHQNFNHFNSEPGSVYSKLAQKANTMANIYQAEDVFMRILMYQSELARYKRAYEGTGKAEAEIEAEVAQIIRNTYQDYNQVPQAISTLSKMPLFGTFVSFQSEAIRTSFNTIKQIRSELQSDNANIRQIGRRRAIAFASTVGTASALGPAIGLWASGMGEEEDEAVRRFAAPWDEGSPLIHVNAPDGQARFINTSYYSPWGLGSDFIVESIFGPEETTVENVLSAAGKSAETFLSTELVTQKVIEAITNKRKTGGKIYNPAESDGTKAALGVQHILSAMTPGIYDSAKRLGYAYEFIEPPRDREYEVPEEVLGAVGLRVNRVDIKKGLKFKALEFNRKRRDAKKILNDAVRDPSADELDGLRRANKAWREAFKSLEKDVGAAYTLNLSWGEVRDVLDENRVSEEMTENLEAGLFEPFTLQDANVER